MIALYFVALGCGLVIGYLFGAQPRRARLGFNEQGMLHDSTLRTGVQLIMDAPSDTSDRDLLEQISKARTAQLAATKTPAPKESTHEQRVAEIGALKDFLPKSAPTDPWDALLRNHYGGETLKMSFPSHWSAEDVERVLKAAAVLRNAER